jgi:hypothetical protein
MAKSDNNWLYVLFLTVGLFFVYTRQDAKDTKDAVTRGGAIKTPASKATDAATDPLTAFLHKLINPTTTSAAPQLGSITRQHGQTPRVSANFACGSCGGGGKVRSWEDADEDAGMEVVPWNKSYGDVGALWNS